MLPTGPTDQLPVEDLAVLRSRRSAKWRSWPSDVLPLDLAEMDFAIAPEIAETLHRSVSRSDLGYAWPGTGLGESLSAFAARRWRWSVQPEWVTAVTDVGVGVVELLRVITRRGDHVVINPPVYPPFFKWPAEVGARLLEVPLQREGDGYRLDLSRIEEAFSKRPAAYLLCNPQNPVGRVHLTHELEKVVSLAAEYRVKIISDEIFGPLTLPDSEFTPLLTIPGADDLAIAAVSASKSFNIAGLKCGALVAGSAAMAALLKHLPREISWRAGHLGVVASIAAFSDGDAWLDRLLKALSARRSMVGTLLAERLPMVTWRPPDAGYLAWLDFVEYGLGARAQTFFVDESKVALDDGGSYGLSGSSHLRMNFATSQEILDSAFSSMAEAVGRLPR